MSTDNIELTVQQHAEALFSLSTTQIIVILGIIIFGMATFINTYNAITTLESDIGTILDNNKIQRDLWIQFGWTIGFSLLMLVISGILIFIFKSRPKILVVGFSTLGIFGIIYAFLVRFQYSATPNQTWANIKMYISWALFIMFIVVGIIMTLVSKEHLKVE